VVAVSESIAEQLRDCDDVSTDRIVVIPNAVPANSMRGPAAPRGGPLIGVVARLHPEKGVHTFLEAAAIVSRTRPEARFLVVGQGPLDIELRKLAASLELHSLRFVRDADARAVIPSLSMLVVPSIEEGAPLVVLEGLAAGVPLVASRVGGIPGQARHGVEALLVPAGDATGFASSLLHLLDNPQIARRLSTAGRARAEAFRHEAMTGAIARLYRESLDAAYGIASAPSVSHAGRS
jgi:glycosyltransferase involved in cell wall biosynthesis